MKKNTTEDDVIVELLCELAEQDAELTRKDGEIAYLMNIYERLQWENDDLQQQVMDTEFNPGPWGEW